MRPEAERRLREGFQRRVDEQGNRYAAQLAHARQQANRFECGEVAGVFSAQAGGEVPRRTYVVAFLPIAAIPVLIAIAATGFPGTLPLLGAFPFIAGAWIGVTFWRGRTPKRQVWLYAFTEGFLLRTFGKDFTVGREGSLIIDDDFASGQHARFLTVRGLWYIEDLDSTNGTMLNGRPILSVQLLKRRDKIKIGHTVMTVVSV